MLFLITSVIFWGIAGIFAELGGRNSLKEGYPQYSRGEEYAITTLVGTFLYALYVLTYDAHTSGQQ